MGEKVMSIDICVKNLRDETPKNPWDIRVDRTSALGNPYVMNTEEDRDVVIDRYFEWFYSSLSTTEVYYELLCLRMIYNKYEKLNLFCWCAPNRCHADIIREYLIREEERRRY